jgi:predicted dehydrogenase
MQHLVNQENYFKVLKIFRFFKIYGIRKTLFKVSGRSRGRYSFLKFFLISKNKVPDIGIIGCGQFSYSTIGSVITGKYGNRFLDCYDKDDYALETFANFYNIKNSDDLHSILDNKNIKYVYIASNHESHTDYAIEALKKNKTVYIEKPIAVSHKQLSRLLKVSINSKKPLYAGYNRPFSKAILDLKNHVPGNIDMPITFNCFISAHNMPLNHWYRDKKEGTRICGNVGHWLDLSVHILSWSELPDKWEINVSYSNLISRDDDISISLTSPRGDLIVIVITSRSEPFEGINETINFQQGQVICKIDDFRTSKIWKNGVLIEKKYRPKDVGHNAAICQPFEEKYAREWHEVVKSSLLMLHIADMVKNSSTSSSFSFSDSLINISK